MAARDYPVILHNASSVDAAMIAVVLTLTAISIRLRWSRAKTLRVVVVSNTAIAFILAAVQRLDALMGHSLQAFLIVGWRERL
jgi:hypothetical protein